MNAAYRSPILRASEPDDGVICLGGVLDDRAEVLQRVVAELHEAAEEPVLGRDLGLGDPAAVDVAEQVVLRPDLGVEAGLRDARPERPVRRAGAGRPPEAAPRPAASSAETTPCLICDLMRANPS